MKESGLCERAAELRKAVSAIDAIKHRLKEKLECYNVARCILQDPESTAEYLGTVSKYRPLTKHMDLAEPILYAVVTLIQQSAEHVKLINLLSDAEKKAVYGIGRDDGEFHSSLNEAKTYS